MVDLLQFDEWLFRLINIDWQNPWLDQWMPLWRNKYAWAPIYIFLLSFVLVNFPKKGIWWILGLVLCVSVSDTMSSKVIKKTVKRPRPCHTVNIQPDFNVGVRCGSGYSFPSSHATNHFAVALFIFMTMGKRFGWIRPFVVMWAASIAYGQVYVGVHYPLDVTFGGLLGILIGIFIAWLYNQLSSRKGVQLY